MSRLIFEHQRRLTPPTTRKGTITIEPPPQLRMHAGDVRTALATAGDRGDFHLGMTQQQLDGFQRRVPGGTKNGNANHSCSDPKE